MPFFQSLHSTMQRTARPKKKPAKGARPPEEEEGPPLLDVETMLQQERARQAHEQLSASHAALDELASVHAALQEERRHEEREGREVALLFRSEMTAKGEALAAAQAEVEVAHAALAAAQAAAAEREAALHAAFDQERQALVVAAGALQAQLDSVAEWQWQKQEAEVEMAQLRSDNARIAEEAGEKVRALQRRLYELGHDGDDGDSGGLGVRGGGCGGGKDGTEDLCLEADLHRLLAHSRKQADEMRHYGQEAEELQREMHALEEERSSLMRHAALAGEMEQQYAKRGTLQAREIRDQRSKISTLEKGLARMAAEFEAEKAALETELRAQLADAAAEQNSLRRLLQVRTKELRQVRRLAQEVLLQRSDVEAFLVSSIQHVRNEMAADAAAAAVGAGGTAAGSGAEAAAQPLQRQSSQAAVGPCKSGSDEAGPSGSSSRRSSSLWEPSEVAGSPAHLGGGAAGGAAAGGTRDGMASQVDIGQLTWQDRERILRLLFAKINRAVQRPLVPTVVRTQALSEAQAEAPLVPPLRGVATEAGPAGLA